VGPRIPASCKPQCHIDALPAGWRLSLGLGAVPALILLVGSIMLPDTPAGLIERGFTSEGRKVLQTIRGVSGEAGPEGAEGGPEGAEGVWSPAALAAWEPEVLVGGCPAWCCGPWLPHSLLAWSLAACRCGGGAGGHHGCRGRVQEHRQPVGCPADACCCWASPSLHRAGHAACMACGARIRRHGHASARACTHLFWLCGSVVGLCHIRTLSHTAVRMLYCALQVHHHPAPPLLAPADHQRYDPHLAAVDGHQRHHVSGGQAAHQMPASMLHPRLAALD